MEKGDLGPLSRLHIAGSAMTSCYTYPALAVFNRKICCHLLPATTW